MADPNRLMKFLIGGRKLHPSDRVGGQRRELQYEPVTRIEFVTEWRKVESLFFVLLYGYMSIAKMGSRGSVPHILGRPVARLGVYQGFRLSNYCEPMPRATGSARPEGDVAVGKFANVRNWCCEGRWRKRGGKFIEYAFDLVQQKSLGFSSAGVVLADRR